MENKIENLKLLNKILIKKLKKIGDNLLKNINCKNLNKALIKILINSSDLKSVSIESFFIKEEGKYLSFKNIEKFCSFCNIDSSVFYDILKMYSKNIIPSEMVKFNIERKVFTGFEFKIYVEKLTQRFSIEPFTIVKYRNVETSQSYSIGHRSGIHDKLIKFKEEKYCYLLQKGIVKNIFKTLNFKNYYICPDVSSLLFHEACGHFLEADMLMMPQTPFSLDSKNKVITSEKLNIISENNGKYLGASSFDDEGTICQSIYLIKNGRIDQYMTDSNLADIVKQSPRGNYRSQNILEKKPHIRMTNFIVKNSGTKIYDKFGIFLTDVRKIKVRSNGDFQCIFNGFFYKNVKYNCDILYADNIKSFLSKIVDISNDQIPFTGDCYKGTIDGRGEFFTVTNAAPTIKLSDMNLKILNSDTKFN
ncbi:hypothetical protein KST01_09400 [Fusobacterium animalis]|jgi:hypothetical protein|uniref:metallopeptidase TldD-related protein n=1 Tax=Fusobacterium TaxID=848 RepID=UPI0025F8C42A|nr:metallopeptidase TldD-related protein [uncultured Fusobacterium sp.]